MLYVGFLGWGGGEGWGGFCVGFVLGFCVGFVLGFCSGFVLGFVFRFWGYHVQFEIAI